MLDRFTVFSKSGLVLFDKNFAKVKDSVVWKVVSDVIIEQRSSDSKVNMDAFTFIWIVDSTYDLVFLVIHLPHADNLLQVARSLFIRTYGEDLLSYSRSETDQIPAISFDKVFEEVSTAVENGDTLKADGSNHQRVSSSEEETNKELKRTPKKGKEKRTWDGKVSAEEREALDFSDSKDRGDDGSSTISPEVMEALKAAKSGKYEIRDMDAAVSSESRGKSFSWFGLMDRLSGRRKISEADADPLLKAMQEDLINKNVASEVAVSITDSVKESIVGKTVGTFESFKTVVSKSVENAIRKILTPTTSTDILREVYAVRKQKRPYSIAFIGVNGVGKSTNLSKVCFWLLQNKLSVLIAACDTFRSGAVEQLGTHVRNLSKLGPDTRIELYQKGYGKDAAIIAKDAIQHGRENGFDIVLIDTAGRMQNNEPLMRSLAKLISVNTPDKVIFVGEALVGNESLTQLGKFNQALIDYSGVKNPRQIDGMILTKFDTIDEKVGAALSMTFITGKPIFFVGTGQTYTDLRRMNVQHIAETLMK